MLFVGEVLRLRHGQFPFNVSLGLLAVADGITDDVCHVIVGKGVRDLAATSLADDEPRRAEHSQVLRNERLRGVERFDKLMDTARSIPELDHDQEPEMMSERTQELSRVFDPRLRSGASIHALISISA
jgi:hypothetical protein